MISTRATRYGTLLSVVLALALMMALAACETATPDGTPGSLLEREATQEAGPSATDPTPTPSLLERAAEREATPEAGPSATDPTPTSAADPTITVDEAAELDRAALVALYEATGGDGWTDNANWLSDSPIGQWSGVTVHATGRVAALALTGNNLVGTVPPELGSLTALAQIDLGGNRLDGCLPANLRGQLNIPGSDLAGLPFCAGDRDALVALYEATGGDSWTDNDGWLSDSPIGQWYGVTADDSGQVTALGLNDNNLVGTVPPDLSALTALILLDLGGNRLDGCVPVDLYARDQLDVRPLGRAPNPPLAQTSAATDKDALLAIFNATDDPSWDDSGTWAGRAPIGEWEGVTTDEAGRVVQLIVILGGAEIPPEVGHLTGLTTLMLGGVSGEIPPELGYLENLTTLALGGVSGEIPPELGNLGNLTTLALGGVSREIRSELEILPEQSRFFSWAERDLAGNQLCGKLPPELGGLANLTRLFLGGNQLSGWIPPELGSAARLQYLDLKGNWLTGGLPPELGSLESLRALNLADNQLTGELPPELGSLASLEQLYLQNNQLTGEIPARSWKTSPSPWDISESPRTGLADVYPTS